MSQSKRIGQIVYYLVLFSFLLYLFLSYIGYCSYCVWQKIMFWMHANNNTLRDTKTFSFFVRQWSVYLLIQWRIFLTLTFENCYITIGSEGTKLTGRKIHGGIQNFRIDSIIILDTGRFRLLRCIVSPKESWIKRNITPFI